MSRRVMVGLLSVLASVSASAAPPPVSLGSLLSEMVDRGAIARLPDPWYTCAQASSYDRRSVSPEDSEGWFANHDASQFIRVEERDGRREYVMMDAEGPGAIVRIWSANPKGTLRIYLDGQATPALEAPMDTLLGGAWSPGPFVLTPPLAATRARGWNLYLPIPYASRCIVTSDADGFYYQVNYRTYEPGTAVEPFSMDTLRAQADAVARVQRSLADPSAPYRAQASRGQSDLRPGRTLTVDLSAGPAAVHELSITLDADDLAHALRTLVLEAEFDGTRTVWCPLGDFFGSGVGGNEFEDWWRTVADEGRTLHARWPMPYERAGRLAISNLGTQTVTLSVVVRARGWEWDDRSMHFHTTWRQENPIPTRPMRDWNYADISGRGVYVGDTLAVVNPVPDWWGEGDEKIYVDGETFPSHFGTGTEDYYGYAWCSPELFTGPFHAQPRCDGPGNYGHTTVSRVRLLDGIPFGRSLTFDMEVWHWKECEVGYAATTHFYARPGATTNVIPAEDEVGRGVINPPPLPPPFTIEGAIEIESLRVVAGTPGMSIVKQDMSGFARDRWSGNAHLWVQGRAPGEFVEIEVPVEDERARKIALHATRSWDYGIVRVSVNGTPVGEPIDLFSGRAGLCEPTGPIDLPGWHKSENGTLRLRIEVVGGNPNALGTRAFFGLDAVVLQPIW
ncbi:MAG: DUF2961 domain-containing protein [Phycisphaerales bacterium]|nr:DUF2961 domain-containing protein [Phycisphaerales bacterium]